MRGIGKSYRFPYGGCAKATQSRNLDPHTHSLRSYPRRTEVARGEERATASERIAAGLPQDEEAQEREIDADQRGHGRARRKPR